MARQIELAGVTLDALSPSEVVAAIEELVQLGRGGHVVTANVDHMVLLRRDPAFRAAYSSAALRLIDGAPVAWLGWLAGYGRLQRNTGADLLPRLCRAAAVAGWSVVLAGGPVDVAGRAADRLRDQLGDALQITAYEMGQIDDRAVGEAAQMAAAELGRLKPALLFIGLGSPKQELWASRHASLLESSVVVGCGAGIEFTAGTVRRAPRLLQRLGLEWAFRLAVEPRRLWRRYLLRDPVFLVIAIEELYRSRRRRGRGSAP